MSMLKLALVAVAAVAVASCNRRPHWANICVEQHDDTQIQLRTFDGKTFVPLPVPVTVCERYERQWVTAR